MSKFLGVPASDAASNQRFPRHAVIVFGGGGFIGSHLLAHLAQRKSFGELYSVDVAEPRLRVGGVKYIKHDLRTPIPPGLCGGGSSYIFNLAAVHVTPGHQDWEYYWTNVLAARHVCQFASETGSNEIVFTSSISVYGPSENAKDEDAPLEPVSAYGRSKLLAEKVHELWQGEHRLNRKLTIVRPAVIYGPVERGNFTRLANLLSRGRFVYPGRRDTIKACGYVKDLVSSMLYMMEHDPGIVTYNFCYPDRYTSEDICSAFCDAAGFKPPRIVAPIEVMLLGGLAFEFLARLGLKTSINRDRVRKLFHSTNIVPKRLREAGFTYGYDLKSSLTDWRSATGNGDFT